LSTHHTQLLPQPQRVTAPALVGASLATVLLYVVSDQPFPNGVLWPMLLTLAPASALAISAAGLATVPKRMGRQWVLYALAALAALGGEVIRHGYGSGTLAVALAGLSAVLLVAGGYWSVPRRRVRRWTEMALELLLLFAAAATSVLHWVPELLGHFTEVSWAAFWGGVAVVAWRRAGGTPGALRREDSRRIMRVIPAVVLVVFGLIFVEVLYGRPIPAETLAGVLLVGLLLACNLWLMMYALYARAAERLELSHSRALIEVSQALAGARDLDATLELVTTWAVRLLDGKAAVLELLTPEGDMLELRALTGLPDEMVGLRFPLEDSFTGWVARNGRCRTTANTRQEPLLHAVSVPYLGRSALAAVPLQAPSGTLGVLACVRRRPFSEADVELLSGFASQATAALETARLFGRVHQLSVTDPLTGLANRRQLERDLAREFAAARRGRRLIVVMFDLNDFKEYNDRYGHVAGDAALRAFGEALGTETRAMNLAARYGGDEFIALLADSEGPGAEIFIERVRERFLDGADAQVRQLGFAAGFAEYMPDMADPQQLVAAADQALYRAKAPKPSRTSR
jgi:diguanylate cyclase (GGDEF)-like protein